MLNEKELKKIKEMYPPGTRIKLNYMVDDCAIPIGTCGTVELVDDEGQILMNWDNGRTLSLIVGEDKFEIIDIPKDEEKSISI